ncbi:MAG: thermonuclease family protein [Alicyclobacillaceae bacterium]|nr:thermonuclease family protein [Alicyclobacillaceae bacterium]
MWLRWAGLAVALCGLWEVSAEGMPRATAPVARAASSVHALSGAVRTAKRSAGLIPAVVTRDVDGDTIHVRMPDGREETIRMLLIDTPEDVKPGTPVEPFSLQAAAFARQELPVGKRVYLEEGVPGHQRDKYGRLLAFVYVKPGDMYNEDVVRRGLARVAYVEPPNTMHLSALRRDEQYAKSRHLGIWSIPGYVTPTGFNLQAVQRASGGAARRASGGGAAGTRVNTAPGLRLVGGRLSVAPGEEASITVQTTPGALGTIEVDYKSGPSHARGLEPAKADGHGQITWTWMVGTHTTPGQWPVVVRVGSRTLRATLTVR